MQLNCHNLIFCLLKNPWAFNLEQPSFETYKTFSKQQEAISSRQHQLQNKFKKKKKAHFLLTKIFFQSNYNKSKNKIKSAKIPNKK